tara:strand:+ start:87 stop:341 length:255 start_codon:yes stop_codon:yes gene_type:complete
MKNLFIRLARFHLGDISQKELAELLGCTTQTLHFAETGKREAKPIMLLAIECLLRRADKWPIDNGPKNRVFAHFLPVTTQEDSL